MCRRAKLSCFRFVVLDAFDITIERQIKIKTCLLTIGNYIEASRNLVMNRSDHGIFDHFLNIGSTKLVKVLNQIRASPGKDNYLQLLYESGYFASLEIL